MTVWIGDPFFPNLVSSATDLLIRIELLVRAHFLVAHSTKRFPDTNAHSILDCTFSIRQPDAILWNSSAD